MKKLLTVILCVAVLMMSLVACKSQEPSTTTEQNANSTGGTEVKQEKYAIVLKVLSSQFWQSMEAGIQAKADELGIQVDVYAANSEDDVEGQVAVVENLLSQGYLGIGVAPLSADNLVNVVAEANKQGILVANIDEKMNIDALEAAGGSLVSFVTTDNKSIGQMAGEYIAETIGSGEVAIIEGKAGNASGEDRKAGAEAAFKAAGLTIVDSQPADWDRTKAFDLATNLISKYENLKAIYCANDTMAMGAQEAVANSGKDIMVVGTDGNDDAIQSVKDGGLAATIAQDPGQIGARSLELLVEAVKAAQKPGAVPMVEEKVSAILINE